MKKTNRIFTIILSMIMCLSLFPVTSQAATAPQIGHARNSNLSNAEQVSITPASDFTDWTVVLRPESTSIADKMVSVCKAGCANNNIRYSQAKRATLYTAAKKVKYDLSKINSTVYCDCSSFMALCAIAAGVNVDYTSTTSNMKKNFVNSGKFTAVTVKDSTYLKKGDIILKAGSHTAMVLENGSNANKSTTSSNSTKTSSSISWPATKNIKTYVISTENNTTVYQTATSTAKYGTIYASDLITINGYSGSRLKVTYPVSGGTKTGYIDKSKVTSATINKATSKKTAIAKITTYRRSSGNTELGYISKGDVYYTIATANGRTQVIYPISGGYKMGWIK